ncbi:MAG: MATE family efflux transporter [Spirochaetaceae bacterium]|nr:MATE family efflux transporter [Spirochaetaceae bacterium]
MRPHEVDVLDTSRSKSSIIWALAWPAILEQVLQVMVNYVDSAMVGRLGAEATASISLNISTIWLVNGFMNSIAIGFAILMAHAIGSRHTDRAEHIIRQAILTEAVLGLLQAILVSLISLALPTWMGADPAIRQSSTDYLFFIALGYLSTQLMIGVSTLLRLSGDTCTPLLLNGLNNVLNIVCNLFFIFDEFHLGNTIVHGLGFGVAGAAMATSLAATITAILLLCAISRKSRYVHLAWKASWHIDSHLEMQGFRLSVPIIFERCTLSLGQIVLTAMVTGLGITALAAHYLANTAEQLSFLPPSGFATAATTLVAQSLGACRPGLAKDYADTCIKRGFGLMLCMATLMFIFAPQLLSLFSADLAVITLGAFVLRIEAFGDPGLSMQQLVGGVLRGAGDTRMPFLISFLGMWVVRLPLAWGLIHFLHLGLEAVWIAMMADLAIRGIVSFTYYRKGRWTHALHMQPQS